MYTPTIHFSKSPRKKCDFFLCTYESTCAVHEYVCTYIHVDWAGVAISTTRGYGYEDRVVCVVWGVWGVERYYDE